MFFKGLDKGEAPPPPPPAPTPRTPSDEEKAEAVNLDVQGLNISEVSIYVSNASQFTAHNKPFIKDVCCPVLRYK